MPVVFLRAAGPGTSIISLSPEPPVAPATKQNDTESTGRTGVCQNWVVRALWVQQRFSLISIQGKERDPEGGPRLGTRTLPRRRVCHPAMPPRHPTCGWWVTRVGTPEVACHNLTAPVPDPPPQQPPPRKRSCGPLIREWAASNQLHCHGGPSQEGAAALRRAVVSAPPPASSGVPALSKAACGGWGAGRWGEGTWPCSQVTRTQ